MNDADPRQRYFIRADYVTNEVRTAAPEQNYWTPKRIETSTLFQYHVYRRAQRLLRGKPSPRVLDIGCGTARKAVDLLIPLSGYYCGIDQASAIEFCQRTIKAPQAEFLTDNLEDPATRKGRFDLIICADVIEHLAAPEKLLAFALESLAPDGRLVISTPERDIMRGRDAVRSPNLEHVREWNRSEFRKLLVTEGFRVLSLGLAPQFRIPLSKKGIRMLRSQLGRPIGYWGCQLAVCAKG
jgi:SAM-dependent methyltransferase